MMKIQKIPSTLNFKKSNPKNNKVKPLCILKEKKDKKTLNFSSKNAKYIYFDQYNNDYLIIVKSQYFCLAYLIIFLGKNKNIIIFFSFTMHSA